jgi:hypothetical protein
MQFKTVFPGGVPDTCQIVSANTIDRRCSRFAGGRVERAIGWKVRRLLRSIGII